VGREAGATSDGKVALTIEHDARRFVD